MQSTLKELINEKGYPKAWCDHKDETQSCFGVWEFDQEIIFTLEGCYLNGIKISGNPIEILQKSLNEWKHDSENIAAVGFFSYDFKKTIFPHIPFKKTENLNPYFWFGKPKEVFMIKNDKSDILNNVKLTSEEKTINYKDYKKNIATIKCFLEKGDVYQINYTYPKLFNSNINPFELYQNLRNTAQPQYGWFLDLKLVNILSFSPERFFQVTNGRIVTSPIKGTRERSLNPMADKELAEELFQSKKDRAEHLMIVDLLRNDLGKICEFGSINVKDLYNVKSFETVHHMVTEINGYLKTNICELDIISSMFPGGSITGAPKERAMQIIDSLENYSRGIYTGTIGYITTKGDMDFNSAIRTMTIKDNIAIYPVGGGIVWDSKAEEEWNETNTKTKILNDIIENK